MSRLHDYLITDALILLEMEKLRRADLAGGRRRRATKSEPKPKTDKRKAVKAARKQRRKQNA